jgi:methylenetetrahydrofolate dehydrogenase (NADP+)/methenyltetrahydrofolate cyclohydrolase/formyltetrahydrofolate synthetase
MTVAVLIANTLKSAERFAAHEKNQASRFEEKVPNDIEIAMSQHKHITLLAEEIGLLPDELESCGKCKAKVQLSVLDRLAHRTNGKYIVITGDSFDVVFDPCIDLSSRITPTV